MKSCPTCQRRFIHEQLECPLDDTALVDIVEDTRPDFDIVGEGRLGSELGKYKLVALLGGGGMGHVYVGAHTKLKRYVAIKVPRSEQTDRVASFFEESRTVGRLKHPNIVEVIDTVDESGTEAYCVLELLRGPMLTTVLREPIAMPSAVHIAAQIADALAEVHDIGVVHRDLKPDNVILIERDGRRDFVKLIDFGTAQMTEKTGTGGAMGTAAYMAPEQAAGRAVDGRADVYSLGVILYYMLVGEHPFPSNTDAEFLMRHVHDEPTALSRARPDITFPRELEDLVARCLHKDPVQRYDTAWEVAEELRSIDLFGGGKRTSKKGFVFAGAGAIAVAAVAVSIVLMQTDDQARAVAPAPAPTEAIEAPVLIEAPTTAPKPAARVSIRFSSTPEGAKVFRGGETVPLGTTPFEESFLRSDRTANVRFVLEGYESAKTDYSLTEDTQVSKTLVASAHKKRPKNDRQRSKSAGVKTTTKKTVVPREGFVDPFAD